jgi:hypothetical protein
MPSVFLKDVDSNPSEAEVDEHTLIKGDEDNPTELTDDQVARLRATGVKLDVAGPDEIDDLKGDVLDAAVKEAEIEGASSLTAEEKRQALRDAGWSAGQTSGGDS